MVVCLKLLYGIPLLLMSIGCVSSMDADVSDCNKLQGGIDSMDKFTHCMNYVVLSSEHSFRLDISQASPEQLDAVFGKVTTIGNIVVIAKSSTLKKISFPALTAASNLQFELWNNHELKSVEFPVLDRNISTFGTINIVGNELMNQATLAFFNNVSRSAYNYVKGQICHFK